MILDQTETIGRSIVYHGPSNDCAYLVKLHPDDSIESIINQLYNIAVLKRYNKILVKIPTTSSRIFINHNFKKEASVSGLFNGKEDAIFLTKYFNPIRGVLSIKNQEAIKEVLESSVAISNMRTHDIPSGYELKLLGEEHIPVLSRIYYCEILKSYPHPNWQKEYLTQKILDNVKYFGLFDQDQLISAASVKMDKESGYAEMSDFATLPQYKDQELSSFLLRRMIVEMKMEEIKTVFTITRATSYEMNRTFGAQEFQFGGTLINNTLIGGSIETMNVWSKRI